MSSTGQPWSSLLFLPPHTCCRETCHINSPFEMMFLSHDFVQHSPPSPTQSIEAFVSIHGRRAKCKATSVALMLDGGSLVMLVPCVVLALYQSSMSGCIRRCICILSAISSSTQAGHLKHACRYCGSCVIEAFVSRLLIRHSCDDLLSAQSTEPEPPKHHQCSEPCTVYSSVVTTVDTLIKNPLPELVGCC